MRKFCARWWVNDPRERYFHAIDDLYTIPDSLCEPKAMPDDLAAGVAWDLYQLGLSCRVTG